MAAPKGLYIAFRSVLADVPTPSDGKFVMFVDDDTLNFSIMHDDGSVVVLASATLSALAELTGAADKLGYFTGLTTAALTDFTAAARTLLAAASASDERTVLGVYSTSEVDTAIAAGVTGGASDVMIFKGVIDCSANPNYPAADAGNLYKVSVAGKIGGASGPNVEAGDTLYCITDSTASGNQATVGAHWVIVQENIDGAVIGPTSVTDSRIACFDGTTGKLLKDGGKLLTDFILNTLLTTLGDTIYASAANTPARLAGNTTTTPKYWRQTGTGSVSAAPQLVALPCEWERAISDESTALTTGTAKLTFRAPYGMVGSEVRININTVSSSGIVTVDVKKNGTTIFSTLVTIDVGEKTSVTAAVPAVISDTAWTDDAEFTVDITVAGTGAKGLKLTMLGSRT